MTAPVLLEVKGLQVERGGSLVLDIPSLCLNENETVAIIGPNGAGKSSLLLSLANLIQVASGSLFFRQQPIEFNRDETGYRRRLAMVFQEPLLFDATVAENVGAGLKIRGMAKKEISRQVDECMGRFRISHLAGRSARRLSGGEAQRTSLARAFATEPELILLDEPFSSLDPLARRDLIEDLQKSLHSGGKTVTALIATHDREEVLNLAERVLVVEDGRIIQSALPDAVMKQPASQFAEAFFGSNTPRH